MIVFTDKSGWYPDDINSRLDFDNFADNLADKILFVGHGCFNNQQVVNFCLQNKDVEKIYINLEHPCSLYDENENLGIRQQMLFDTVYTICPYTAEWFNSIQNKTKFFSMPYPHNLKYDVYKNKDLDKKYDVAYNGLIHSEEIASYVEAIKGFDYFFSTIPQWNRIKSVNGLATHNNIDNLKKWEILSQSKSAIIQNNLYLLPKQIGYIKNNYRWQENNAFSHVEQGLLPQLKSRTVESAICQTLMLVKKDPWNVIEEWFEPGKDFLYFENCSELKELVEDVKNNFNQYEHIVESAYKKVKLRYNTKYIFEKIKNGENINENTREF